MLIVKVQKGNINRALKQFKRKFRDTKVIKELREKQYYTKPSIAKRQAKEKAIIRDKYRRDNDEQRITRIKCRFQSNNRRML